MAAAGWQPGALIVASETLLQLFESEAFAFRFFQAVRMLQLLHPERAPVGHFVAPSEEVVRFSSRTSLTFPPSELHRFTHNDEGPHKLEVNFLGLSTVGGPLPHPYAEHLLERARAKDHAAGDFFDLFNHRLVSLFFRAWAKYRLFVSYESDQARASTREEDTLSSVLFSLLGLGTAGLRGRSPLPQISLLYYAGLLSRTTRTAQGLRQILEEFFSVEVQVEEFSGNWNPLPQESLTFLRDGQDACEQLGMGTIVGDEVWDQHGTVTVRLGPMSRERYQAFLPGRPACQQLEAWLHLYGGGEFDFAVRLVLARDEVPGLALTSDAEGMSQLGYTSWLKTRAATQDAADALYRVADPA